MSPRSTYHHTESFELRVLGALASGASRPEEISAGLNEPLARIQTTLDWAVGAEAVSRLDAPSGATYSLTPKGLEIVGLAQGVDAAVGAHGRVDVGAATRLVMEQYDAAREVATENAERDQADWAPGDSDRDRVTSALNDAYARGALTKEQLDDRTGRALAATTMGELRGAADGVLDLPPVLNTGIGRISGQPHVASVEINPALRKVRWHHLLYAAAYVVIGFLVTFLSTVVGLIAIVAGLGLAAWTLRPLFSGRRDVTSP
ncbi:MAG: DUF1707 domain-containing protein [Nocardioides sp.]